MFEFTPKFQEVYDELYKRVQGGDSRQNIQDYFRNSCLALGAEERLNNLYRIRPKRPIPGEKSRLQFFRRNKLQSALWNQRTNRDLVLKMRQGGVTTDSCMVALDKALWEDGTHSAIMAHIRDNVKKFFRITKTGFRQFQADWGDFYPVTNTRDNVSELAIAQTGSELIVCTESKGLTLDFLHISEAAFVEDARISESIESVPFTGRVVMETTPDTASGMFYDLWDLYYKSIGDPHASCLYTAHFFPWWFQYPEEEDLPSLKTNKEFKYTDKEELLVREHQLSREHILWRRLKITESGGDEGEFLRKYPEDPLTCFLSGSKSVFPAEVLTSLWHNERSPAYTGDLRLA